MISGPAVLLLVSLGAAQPTDSAGLLLEAAVRIVLYPSYARVIALYTVDRNGTELRFDAMRAREQLVLIDQITGEGLNDKPQQMIDRRRLAAPSGPSGEAAYRIVYSVSGDLTRLPLFVPNTMVDRSRTQLHIEVIGHADGIELPAGESEFQAVEEGLLVARPPALPRFVTLPGREGRGLSIRRVGWIVLLVLLVVAAAIVHRGRRAHGAGGRER